MKPRIELDPISVPLMILLFFLAPILPMSPAVSAQTLFTVNTTDDGDDGTCDAGHCSLREAITAANQAVDGGIIHFNISGAGPHTIQPLSPLPTLGGGVIIDGTSEPDFAGSPVIELDGSLAGGAHGLDLVGAQNLIRGLVINRFAWSGISVNTDCTLNVIEGNFIGTDVTGTLDLGNGNAGVLIGQAANNTVGGTTAAARNLISGNAFGILIENVQASGNKIQGNYIGTNATGDEAIPNSQSGILLWGHNTVIGGSETGAGNVISGNVFAGIDMGGGSGGATIQGNFIGTDATGTMPLGNDLGIFVNFSSDNDIGGTQSGAGNVISGNTGDGLLVNGLDATGNLIQGNFIGTDVGGTAAVGNGVGIAVVDAPDNTIGGTVEGAGNVISGNANGNIAVYNAAATGNLIQGNFIGTDVSGTVALGGGRALQLINAPGNTIGGTGSGAANLIAGNGNGILIDGLSASGNVIQGNSIGVDVSGSVSLENGGAGVRLSNGAAGNIIGGTTPGAGNVIANSRWMGVILFADAGTGNRIQSNAIYDNSALGIELGRNSVTPNDEGDEDTGPNNFQNYPVLTSVASNGGAAIRANLNSVASSSFTVEFFSNPACDDSGFGQGHTPLGTATLTTDASGNGTATASFSSLSGNVFTATATDLDGNTSEFSACSELTTLTLSSSPSSRTVAPGQSATYGITLTAQGGTFEEVVDLTCSGGPSQTTCTLADNQLDLSSGQASTNLTVTTVAPSASGPTGPGGPSWQPPGGTWVFILALSGLVALILGVPVREGGGPGHRIVRRLFSQARWGTLAAFGVVLLVFQAACGDSGTPPPTGGTAPGTYELTVSATWESLQETATVTLVVQ